MKITHIYLGKKFYYNLLLRWLTLLLISKTFKTNTNEMRDIKKIIFEIMIG